jgi:hypothetical protein
MLERFYKTEVVLIGVNKFDGRHFVFGSQFFYGVVGGYGEVLGGSVKIEVYMFPTGIEVQRSCLLLGVHDIGSAVAAIVFVVGVWTGPDYFH